MDLGRAIARVRHWYPGFTLDEPWLEFWELLETVPSMSAEWRVNIANAVGYALADEKHQQPLLDAIKDAFKNG